MTKTVFRFAIGDEKPLTEIWSVAQNASDLYLTAHSQKHQMKISLHGSGVCQYAMLPEFFREHSPQLASRTILRWSRSPTPSHGSLGALRLIFAADGLWPNASSEKPKKATRLIPTPPDGYAVEVTFSYSMENPSEHLSELDADLSLIGAGRIASGEYVSVFAGLIELPSDFFAERDLPSTHGFMTSGLLLDEATDEIDQLTMHVIAQQHEGMATLYSLHNMKLVRGSARMTGGNTLVE